MQTKKSVLRDDEREYRRKTEGDKVCKNDKKHVMYEEHDAAVTCGTVDGKCKCGREAGKVHDFDKDKWISDESGHWHGCRNCIAREDEVAHNYPNKAADKDIPQTCETCKYGGYITKLEDSEFDDHHITPALKRLGYGNKAAIEEKMHETMAGVESWKGNKNDMKLYEVELMYSEDGGLSWLPALEKHFPKTNGEWGKLAVTLPVDKDIDDHDYTVVHMFSKDAFGKYAGDTETPDVSEFKIGDKSYITFYVTGLSPIMVAWEDAAKVDEAPAPNDGQQTDEPTGEGTPKGLEDNTTNNGNAGNTSNEKTPEGTVDGADTGDDNDMIAWGILAVTAALTAAVTMMQRRKKA